MSATAAPAGDAVLTAVAQRLIEQVRADDMVARLGGDRFAILLKGSPARHKLAEMAIRMLTAGARPVEYEKRLVAGGDLSLGIACHPADATSFEGIVKAGEVALQHCKKQRLGPSYVFASGIAGGVVCRGARGRLNEKSPWSLAGTRGFEGWCRLSESN